MIGKSSRQMRFPEQRVRRYIRSDKVRGWLSQFSAQAIAALSIYQAESGRRGAVAEIGVHHGKLFFILYLTTCPDEAAIAIDVFESQHLNLDASGRGDKSIFLAHARRFSRDLQGLRVIEDSSLNVTPQRIKAEGGPVRLFSIDGCHTEEATLNDLRLAEASLADYGIVALDDVFNQYWPEVSVGLAKYLAGGAQLVPFAITPGKVFLARARYAVEYANQLKAAFPERVDKAARLHGHRVTILGVMPWNLRRRLALSPLGHIVRLVLGHA